MIRLDTLALTSKDLARSRAFYVAKLGFKVLEDLANKSFVVDAGGIKLHVDVAGTRSPLAQAEPRMVFQTSGLTQRCTALRDLGVSVEGPRRVDDHVIAELSDPDGHPITLVERGVQ
jgi:catechol 2,3-dioxygenase-like lactoylglutathione lyase family enzyme